MNRLNDTLVVQIFLYIFEKRKKKKKQAVTQWCQKDKHNPPFLIERPLFHYNIGTVTTGQCHVSSTRVAVMQSCPAFFFYTPVIFHEIRTLWIAFTAKPRPLRLW